MQTQPEAPGVPPLPSPRDTGDSLRLLGVEVEFGGLSEDAAADILAREAGGTVEGGNADLVVTGTPFGDCKVYLDTAYRARLSGDLGRTARELARQLVPVELVTEPFDPARLGDLDALLGKLRGQGAVGTERGLLLGYGVHLNVQIASDRPDRLWSVLTAFALTERLIRRSYPIDFSRRVLPFVDPYPRSLSDALAEGPPASLAALSDIYLTHAPSRNHALDMLPILAHFDADAVARSLGSDHSVSARPAWHYRLPDCRIDDPDWSVTGEWALWVAIEGLAEDRATLDQLCTDWHAHRRHFTSTGGEWAERCAKVLRASGHGEIAGGWQRWFR